MASTLEALQAEHRLKERLLAAGFPSYRDLADAIGRDAPEVAVHASELARVLKGMRSHPSRHLLRVLAEKLSLSMDELFDLIESVARTKGR